MIDVEITGSLYEYQIEVYRKGEMLFILPQDDVAELATKLEQAYQDIDEAEQSYASKVGGR